MKVHENLTKPFKAPGLHTRGPPKTQKWFLYLRGVIAAVSVVIICVVAYNFSLFRGYGLEISTSAGPPVFLLFAAIWSVVLFSSMIYIELKASRRLYRFLFLVLIALSGLFLLGSWAWEARFASLIFASWSRYGGPWTKDQARFGATVAVTASLGALDWALTTFAFVHFLRACLMSPYREARYDLTMQTVLATTKPVDQETPSP